MFQAAITTIRILLGTALIGGGPVMAAASPSMSFQQQGTHLLVSGELTVPVSPVTAWAVLTDYEGIPGFVPGMRISRVIERDGNARVLEQQGEMTANNMRMLFMGTLRVVEEPSSKLSIQFLTGTFRNMQAQWVLDGKQSPVRLSYQLNFDAGTPYPSPVMVGMLQQQVMHWVTSLAAEMERRPPPKVESKPKKKPKPKPKPEAEAQTEAKTEDNDAMNIRFGLAALVLAAGLFGAPAQAADPGLRVDAGSKFGVITIDAEILVPADAKTAWAVLTDYDNLASFVPEMQSSRVISALGQPKRVEQRGKSGMLSFFTPEHIVLQMEEAPYERIRFNRVTGDVKSMRGEWLIVGGGNPVRVLYRARIVPKVPLPPLLGTTMIERDVETKLAAIRREIARRAFVPKSL